MTTDLNVLIVGSGGREHALAWKISQSPRVKQIYVSPGNGGTASTPKTKNVDILQDRDFTSVVAFAKQQGVNLIVPGSEQSLVDGIQNACKRAGIDCFGPSATAAQLEGSKAFAKDFMKRHSIPTAEYMTFTDFNEAQKFIENAPFDVVVKASGLAAGKGVLIPRSKAEAIDAVRRVLVEKEFGQAGNEVVVEEFLLGEECSVLAFTDGYSVVTLPPAQDHKRAYDGDEGPNTGGMGAYAPTPLVTDKMQSRILNEILKPTVDGMRKEGHPYVGILFAGVILTSSGPKTLEFNCRFGDPETQVLLPLLDCDLVDIMIACVGGCLDSVKVQYSSSVAVTVVAASGGYPGSYKTGQSILLPGSDDSLIFHAGTKVMDGSLRTSGGRVLAVTARESSLESALDKTYHTIAKVKFDGMFYRKDIAQRAIKALQNPKTSMSYEDAGVSITNGNALVEKLKSVTAATKRPGTTAEIGGFGGLFDLKAAGYSNDTILVSSTDGVGTKLRIAHIMNKHDTIGIDLVAMNVNDLIVQGAEPLFFLDYYACGKLDVDIAREVVSGVAAGCVDARCALVGGETAEMPGFYQGNDYDLGGFTVGAVERADLLPRTDEIGDGDILLGLPSSGVHSNGFSLVRHIINSLDIRYQDPCVFEPSKPLGEVLLTPTRIYVRAVMPLIKMKLVKAMAHITGGGFVDNLPRVLPKHLCAFMDACSWPLPSVFKWLKTAGNVRDEEMLRTFNCGLGMILIVDKTKAAEVIDVLKRYNEQVYEVGILRDMGSVDPERQVIVENTSSAWSQ